MRIKRLRMQDFRIHKDSVLDIGDKSFVVVKGKNCSGKTTVGQGLSLCLTPTTTGLDGKGRGFTSKIKRGQPKAVLTADLQTKQYLVQRVVTLNASTATRTQKTVCLSDPDWNPAPFDRKMESYRAALTVVLNTDAFLRMDEGEQKNLLAGLALPAHYEFDSRIVEGVDAALGRGSIDWAGEPFAIITLAFKKLFDERQIVNRQVREFTIPEPLPVPVGVDSQSLQDRLTQLRMERREKQQQRDQGVSEASAAEVDRVRVKTRLQGMEEAIRELEHRAQSIRAFVVPEDRIAALRKVAEGKPELDRLSKERVDIEKGIDDYLRQLAKLDDLADVKACPTCEQPIDPAKLTKLSAALAVGLKEAKDTNNALYARIKALGEVEEAIREIKLNEDRIGELVAIDERIEEKSRQLADEEEPQAVLFDFAPYDQTLAELDAEIEKLTDQLRPVIVAEERGKEIVIRKAQHTRLKEKAATLDQLVKYFGPDGIKAKLIGEYIGGFERKVNEVLGAWEYSATLSIEPYQFDILNARGDTIPVRELSGAERVMFSLAFQCAVARTAQIGLVVIDEVAMMLPEIRPLLYKRLYEMIQQGYLEQVILLVADASEQVSKLPGSAFFMVNEGTIYPLRDGTKEVDHAGDIARPVAV